jgi:tRNA A37 threonylcarbamoyladenosine modification protein TsaB
VSALEALVEEARPETEWAAPIIDARRGEFFLGLFRRPPGAAFFRAEGEGLVLRPNELRALLEKHARGDPHGGMITCLVREHDRMAQGLREILPSSTRWQSVAGTLLGAIARIAHRAYKEVKLNSPEELDAYYIRRSDAELQAQQDPKQIQELERRGRTPA